MSVCAVPARRFYEFEHLFAMNNIAEDLFGSDIVLLNTTIGKHYCCWLRNPGNGLAVYAIERDQEHFHRLLQNGRDDRRERSRVNLQKPAACIERR